MFPFEMLPGEQLGSHVSSSLPPVIQIFSSIARSKRFARVKKPPPSLERNGTTAAWPWAVLGVRQYNRSCPMTLNFYPSALQRQNVTSHPRGLVAAGATSFIDMAGEEESLVFTAEQLAD